MPPIAMGSLRNGPGCDQVEIGDLLPGNEPGMRSGASIPIRTSSHSECLQTHRRVARCHRAGSSGLRHPQLVPSAGRRVTRSTGCSLMPGQTSIEIFELIAQ